MPATLPLPLSAHELQEAMRNARPIDAARLDRVLRIAVAPHVFAGLDRAELRRRAVLVGTANEQYFVAELAAETRMHIRGQQRSRRDCRGA